MYIEGQRPKRSPLSPHITGDERLQVLALCARAHRVREGALGLRQWINFDSLNIYIYIYIYIYDMFPY